MRWPVPASDRLTPEEEAQQIERFRDSPDLAARLGRGEWSALWLGEAVAEGYDAAVHVVAERLMASVAHVLAIGWDGGHSPSAVMGQLLGGQLQVLAALNDLRVGVLELIEQQVICWLIQWAPWARQRRDAALVHLIDQSRSLRLSSNPISGICAGRAGALRSGWSTVSASTSSGSRRGPTGRS